ncbi:MAG: hypothetical protein VB878_01625, partial [Pirellulaceae bacterium]
MDPFYIECPTCHARLKVRNEAAIGQILACPKCQSMVQVTNPGAEGAEATVPASDLTETVADSSLDFTAESNGEPTADSFALAPDTSVSNKGDGVERQAPDAWQSAANRQYRQWLTIGLISIAAAVVIIAVFGFVFAGPGPIQVADNPEDSQANNTNNDT